jgi:hypothetical protein
MCYSLRITRWVNIKGTLVMLIKSFSTKNTAKHHYKKQTDKQCTRLKPYSTSQTHNTSANHEEFSISLSKVAALSKIFNALHENG